MNIKDKVVLITGSSSGIGQATAIRFAKEGAKIVVNYRENKVGGEETLKRIKELGADAILVQADISKDEDIKRMLDIVVKKFTRIDVLINNAAIPNDLVPYFDASTDEIKNLVNTDLIAQMVVTQQVLKIMQKQPQGKIINTSSIRGWEHGGRSIVYAVSKAGINSFTRTLAKLVAPNIQVNAIAPGFVKTRNYDKTTPEQIQSFIDQTVLKRWVTEDEIAEAFVFLVNNDAMTGQVIYVDAGFTLK
jgi:3-oxoacyl-[acyl-carrier protein] reductase